MAESRSSDAIVSLGIPQQRLDVIEALRGRGVCTVSMVMEAVGCARHTAIKHLGVLESVRVVRRTSRRRAGSARLVAHYELDGQALEELAWTLYEAFAGALEPK